MNSSPSTRARFLRDNLPVRIGGIAANMARVSSFSKFQANDMVVRSVINESKWFIEWTAAEAEVETAAQLVDLQRQLVKWQFDWDRRWNDDEERKQIGAIAKEWSDRVLEMSGLLDES